MLSLSPKIYNKDEYLQPEYDSYDHLNKYGLHWKHFFKLSLYTFDAHSLSIESFEST